MEELYLAVSSLVEDWDFKLLYVREAGRDKYAVELIAEIGEGTLQEHLVMFSKLVDDINKVTGNAVVGKDTSTGIGIIVPYDS